MTITISAKDLGAMALKNFCPRCFWIKRNSKIPFQIFPGIFSSIDSYTKRVVHTHIDRYGIAPDWLPGHDKIFGYEKVPHWSKYAYQDPETGVVFRGQPDDILKMLDGSRCMPDYKTAKYTASHDKLLPMYNVQLNAYEIIGERVFDMKFSDLYLAYCEPQTGDDDCTPSIFHDNGFDMRFKVTILPVERDHDQVFDLLKKAKGIIDGPMPAGADGCKDCAKLDSVVGLFDRED